MSARRAAPARGAGWMHLGRTALVLIALAAATNLLGYARDIILAAWYGASPQTDAFFVGSFVPLLIYQIVVLGSLVPAFLPVLVQTGAPGPAGDALRRRLVWTMTALAAVLGLGIVVLLGVAAPAVVALIAPGFAPATAAQAVTVLRLSLPLVLFVTPAGVLSAALNYRDRFVAPALAAAATNVGVVLALLFADHADGLAAAALGMSAGAALGLLIVILDFGFWILDRPILDFGFWILDWRLRSNKHSVRDNSNQAVASAISLNDTATVEGSADSAIQNPKSKIQNPKLAVVRTVGLAVPLLGTVGLVQAVAVAERFFGSQLPAGSLSLLTYAMKLNQLPIVILAGTLTTILFPSLSRAAQDAGVQDQGLGVRDQESGQTSTQPATAFSRDLARGITQVVTWTVPAAAWLVVCAGPVMRLLYQRGQFTDADSAQAAQLLMLYALGLVPHALMQMLPRAFHARQDMIRPLQLHGLALLGYLALALIGTALAGAPGLAAAFSGYAYVTLGLFVWNLRADLQPIVGMLGRTLVRVGGAGLLVGVVCAALGRLLAGVPTATLIERAVVVGLLAGAGLAAYALTMTLLHRRATRDDDPRVPEPIEYGVPHAD